MRALTDSSRNRPTDRRRGVELIGTPSCRASAHAEMYPLCWECSHHTQLPFLAGAVPVQRNSVATRNKRGPWGDSRPWPSTSKAGRGDYALIRLNAAKRARGTSVPLAQNATKLGKPALRERDQWRHDANRQSDGGTMEFSAAGWKAPRIGPEPRARLSGS